MTTIVTRAGKGSALTWTEGDANITNLNNDKIENVVDDTTPQLGGNLDVNGKSIVSASNGNIAIVPNGSGNIQLTPSTGKITLGALDFPTGMGTNGQVLTTNGSSTMSWTTVSASPAGSNTQLQFNNSGSFGASSSLTWDGSALSAPNLVATNSSGSEGGEIRLALAASGTTLNTSVTIDIYQNKLRFFETGGSARGAYIDLTAAGAGVGTNLLSGGGGISSVSADTNPSLGGDLNVNGKSIVSASNGNINISPNGSGNINLTPATGHVTISAVNFPTGDGTANQVLKTNGTGQLSWTTPASGTVTSVGGTGTVNGLSLSGTVTSSGSLTLGGTLDLTTAPAIGSTSANTGAFTTLSASGNTSLSGANAAISLQPTGTGIVTINPATASNMDNMIIGATTPKAATVTSLTFKDPREAIYDLGTTGGTIAPNVSNGSVQKITLNSALTINAFTSPVAGQSLTLIIYGGTSYTSITSTMKFAGGIKTLTGTAGCIDILSVYYDGTNYFASLGKGFA